jgi:hypothetical protein
MSHNLYVFLGYVLFENYLPLERYCNFIHSQIFRSVIFRICVIPHVKNLPYFPLSIIVRVIALKSVVSVQKVEKSKDVKKSAMSHCFAMKR